MDLGFIGEVARAFEGMVNSVANTLNVNEQERTGRTSSHYSSHNVSEITTGVILVAIGVVALILLSK